MTNSSDNIAEKEGSSIAALDESIVSDSEDSGCKMELSPSDVKSKPIEEAEPVFNSKPKITAVAEALAADVLAAWTKNWKQHTIDSVADTTEELITAPDSSLYDCKGLLYMPFCMICDNDQQLAMTARELSKKANNFFMFVCPQCGRQFDTYDDWHQHIDREHQLCDPRTFNFTKHPNNSFKCQKCQMVFKRCTLKSLQCHWFTHLPYKVHKCKLCPTEEQSLYLILSHIMLHNCNNEVATNDDDPSKDLLEFECGKYIAYMCPECGVDCNEQEQLQAHLNFKHNYLEKSAENRYNDHFKCTQCHEEIFSQHLHDLQQHLFSHSKFKAYLKCKFCGCTMTRRDFIFSHILNMHNDRVNFSVGQEFPSSSANLSEAVGDSPSLQKLPVSLGEDTSSECGLPSSSTPPTPLTPLLPPVPAHHLSLVHRTSTRDLRSSTSSASSPPSLLTPLAIEADHSLSSDSSDDRSWTADSSKRKTGFKCSGCNKTFASAARRNKHNLATHSKYKCNKCGGGFALKNELRIHRCGKRARKARYVCPKCSKTYSGKVCFKKHVRLCQGPMVNHTEPK